MQGMASEAWEKLFGVVEDFKEELRSWSSKEHAAVQQQAEEAEELKGVLEVSEEPWEHVTELLRRAKAQKEQLSTMCELLQKHAKLLEGSKEKLPQAGAASAEELHRFLVPALQQLAETQKPEAEGKAEAKETHEAQEGSEEEKKAKKKVAKPKKSKTKEKKGREERHKKSSKELESDGSQDYSDYSSYSRTPTPRPRRRRKRRVRRRRRPSPSSYSYTPSPRPRRKRRRNREDKLDVDGEIDRFVKVNKLEERCEKILRDLDSSLACKVMGLSDGNNTFELSGDVRDPTAVVLARIRKAQFARDDGTRGPMRRGARRRSSSSR